MTNQESRLWRTLLQVSEQLDRQFAERKLLDGLSERIRAGEMAGPVLDYLFDSSPVFVPCDRIGIALLNDAGTHLVSRWVRSDASDIRIAAGYAAPLAGSSLQRVIEQGTPRLINDLEHYLRQNPHSESTHRIIQEGMRSSLTCPLVSGGRPVGVVFFSSRTPGRYTEEHVSAFHVVAGQLAVVVEKAQLYQELLDARLREAELRMQLLPATIAERAAHGRTVADHLPDAVVLATRLSGIGGLLEQHEPAVVMQLLDGLTDDFHELASHADVTPARSGAERWLAFAGLQGGVATDNATALVGFALNLTRAVAERSRENGVSGLDLHIGVDSGRVLAGVVGTRSQPTYDLVGECVSRAVSAASLNAPPSIRVSGTCRDLLAGRYHTRPLEPAEARVDAADILFELTSGDSPRG